MKLRPQLAEDAIIEQVRCPVWAEPKIDGVRALNMEGTLTGRSLDPFAGYGITEYWSKRDFVGFDGEMILGPIPNAKIRLCSLTTGAMGKFKGVTQMPDLHWWVFDYITEKTFNDVRYKDRYEMLHQKVKALDHPRIHIVPFEVVTSTNRLSALIHDHLVQNFEGTIVRDPDAFYKGGRSTLKGQHLLRVKQWMDFEMLVTGFTEGSTNTNEKKVNTLGLTERSSAKAGKVANGMIGSLQGTLLADIVHPVTHEVIFKKGLAITMGTGEMTEREAEHYFKHPNEIVGHIAKGKCMLHGSKDAPRFPTFISLRLPQDMS